MLDRLLPALSIAGLVVLAFVLGATALWFKLPGATWIIHAFEAADAKFLQQRLEESARQPREPMKEIIHDITLKRWDQKHTFDGYMAVTRFIGSGGEIYLIDMNAKPVHRWVLPKAAKQRLANTSIAMLHFLPDGSLFMVFQATGKTPYGHSIVKLDKDSNLLWEREIQAHHYLYVDQENGNIYTLTQKFTEPPKGLEGLPNPMLSDEIAILSPDGDMLDHISLVDAFAGTPYAPFLYRRNQKLWDPMHVNSVMKLEPDIAKNFPMFKAGQLLISVRNMRLLAVIDPATKKVVWATRGPWEGQHAAQFLPNGHMLIFDNLGHEMTEQTFSRAIEFDPKTSATKWFYVGATPEDRFFSSTSGQIQRLPNGNTLIGSSNEYRVLEVMPNGKVVWEIIFPNVEKKRTKTNEDIFLNSIIISERYPASALPFLNTQPKANHETP